MYGGTSAGERAHLFASWGLMQSLPSIGGVLGAAMYYYRRMMG